MARLIEELKKLPGIGGKTAQRLAFHILRASDEDAELLADSIRQVKASLHLCSICNNITDVDPCVYCASNVVADRAEVQTGFHLPDGIGEQLDRKSTRLNS